MASAWGESWGSAWGNSWRSIATTSEQNSGGWLDYLKSQSHRYSAKYQEEREKLGIDGEESAIIDSIAARQAKDLRLDEQQRLDELRGELQLRRIEMRSSHIEFLNVQRQHLIDEEIRTYLYAMQQKHEDEAMLLIIAAVL